MQLTLVAENDSYSAKSLTLDWIALGRSVRTLALEAVAMHFVDLGRRDGLRCGAVSIVDSDQTDIGS